MALRHNKQHCLAQTPSYLDFYRTCMCVGLMQHKLSFSCFHCLLSNSEGNITWDGVGGSRSIHQLVVTVGVLKRSFYQQLLSKLKS